MRLKAKKRQVLTFSTGSSPVRADSLGTTSQGNKEEFLQKNFGLYHVTKIIATVTTPCRIVWCMIVGCANRSGLDKGVYFAIVSSAATNQGKEAEYLSRERRSRWISAISRDDLAGDILENDCVFGRKFFFC